MSLTNLVNNYMKQINLNLVIPESPETFTLTQLGLVSIFLFYAELITSHQQIAQDTDSMVLM